MVKDIINIILVDDSKYFVEGMKIILRNYPKCFVLATCSNGKELLESPLLQKADLILMDIQMSVMNGIEAARRVNYEYPNLPIVALTMHLEKVFLDDIIGVGFKGVIYKPEVSKKLNEVIPKVMNKQFVFPDNLNINEHKKQGGVL